ncbi:hypothetical protein RYX36_009511 [Vicia faba]
MCARKNATPSIDIYDNGGSDCEIFASDEAKRRFTDCIFNQGIFYERGFTFDPKDENLGIPASIAFFIQSKKWHKLRQHPGSYNIQIVKEFYSNLKPANKKSVVMVRGFEVSYSEGTISMMFDLKKVEEEYHDILSRADESEYEVYMQSLCNPNTTWVGSGGEKFVRRMELKLEPKVWYQFIKHSIKPTTHNETANKR